jgi:hypothetical protein
MDKHETLQSDSPAVNKADLLEELLAEALDENVAAQDEIRTELRAGEAIRAGMACG